ARRNLPRDFDPGRSREEPLAQTRVKLCLGRGPVLPGVHHSYLRIPGAVREPAIEFVANGEAGLGKRPLVAAHVEDELLIVFRGASGGFIGALGRASALAPEQRRQLKISERGK